MQYNKWGVCIRAMLTLGMIYLAYTETGIWTACCLLGCYVGIESHGYILELRKSTNQSLNMIERLKDSLSTR